MAVVERARATARAASPPWPAFAALSARLRKGANGRWGLAASVLVVAVLGAWLGLVVGGQESAPVGPVGTHMSAGVSAGGGTDVRIGPLGTLGLATHHGPIGLTVDVDGVNVADAQHLVDDPVALTGLQKTIGHDVQHAIVRLLARSALAALLGALVLGLLVFRRRLRRVAAVVATAAAMVAASFGTAAATWNPKAITEPRYTGLLAGAPALVGNVSKLYDVTSALPAYQPDPSTIRVLDVSDLHLNPAAWDVIRSITAQFGIGVIVDSGDITDHGTSAERRFVAPIADLKVPYVYVRGNHDSTAIQQAVAAEPNAVVLDGGMVREVGGLRFIGEGDPRFTPDRSTEPAGEDMVAQAGQVTAGAATAATPRPDVAVVHDPVMGQQLDGIVPLVLAGHLHKRGNQVLKAGTRLFVQGSTGGAGLRALEGATPTPIECSVLYFDAVTKHLQAWDDITVGGLGLTSAQIDRTLAPEEAAHLHATAGGGPPPAESEPAAPTAAAVEGAPRRG